MNEQELAQLAEDHASELDSDVNCHIREYHLTGMEVPELRQRIIECLKRQWSL